MTLGGVGAGEVVGSVFEEVAEEDVVGAILSLRGSFLRVWRGADDFDEVPEGPEPPPDRRLDILGGRVIYEH